MGKFSLRHSPRRDRKRKLAADREAERAHTAMTAALAGPGDPCRLCGEVIDADDDCACTQLVERACVFCGGHGIRAAYLGADPYDCRACGGTGIEVAP